MSRTDRIWHHVDNAFKEADKAFRELECLCSETSENGKSHQLRFVARSKIERWRLAKKFAKMSFSVLFAGKTQLNFKHR